MKRANWKWLLPAAQLALALVCHVYAPHEYRVGARRDHASGNMEYFFQHSPALAARISHGINFPALVLDYPLRNADNAIYESNNEYTLIWIAPKDIGFFIGIVLFWHWVGRAMDGRRAGSRRDAWPHQAMIAGLACGAVFGLLTWAYADQMIATKWLPDRETGACGIACGGKGGKGVGENTGTA
jgi:hypothetical protein